MLMTLKQKYMQTPYVSSKTGFISVIYVNVVTGFTKIPWYPRIWDAFHVKTQQKWLKRQTDSEWMNEWAMHIFLGHLVPPRTSQRGVSPLARTDISQSTHTHNQTQWPGSNYELSPHCRQLYNLWNEWLLSSLSGGEFSHVVWKFPLSV